jgi:MSHA pilin protein MshD
MITNRLQLRGRARGFTIVEVSVCVIIVGVMFSAVMQTVGQSAIMQFKVSERTSGMQLARMLMVEIMQQAYTEPSTTTTALGPESGETRPTFEDVDDYNGLSESPPVNMDGTAINVPSASTWRRTVTVVWVNPATLATASPQVETGVKKITVNVSHNGFAVATLTAIRSNAP